MRDVHNRHSGWKVIGKIIGRLPPVRGKRDETIPQVALIATGPDRRVSVKIALRIAGARTRRARARRSLDGKPPGPLFE